MRLVSDNDYLAHHGIIGQKWGVRRFRNKDGSLTAAGKERYSIGSSGSEKPKYQLDKEKFFDQSIKVKDKAPKSPAEVVTGEAQKAVGNTRKGINAFRNLTKSKNQKPINMSDDELRKRINRLELEKRYRDLSASEVGRGEYIVNNSLDLTESVVGIAASAATVYEMFKLARKATGE